MPLCLNRNPAMTMNWVERASLVGHQPQSWGSSRLGGVSHPHKTCVLFLPKSFYYFVLSASRVDTQAVFAGWASLCPFRPFRSHTKHLHARPRSCHRRSRKRRETLLSSRSPSIRIRPDPIIGCHQPFNVTSRDAMCAAYGTPRPRKRPAPISTAVGCNCDSR